MVHSLGDRLWILLFGAAVWFVALNTPRQVGSRTMLAAAVAMAVLSVVLFWRDRRARRRVRVDSEQVPADGERR